ncbi:MAG: hypothetical protein AB7V77_05650 [Candidatus Woesearchaeota archaeon]
MFAIEREEVVKFMQLHGPVVPNDLRKKFQVDTFITGAVLSELSSRGTVKISNMKMGGSPVYYLPEHEYMLENYTQYLNEKDKKTCDWLKQVRIAEDENLETLKRVSLRKLPDFAKPLKARTEDGTEILFWRYFLFPEQEAIDFLTKGKSEVEEKIEEVQAPKQEEHVVQTTLVDEKIVEAKENLNSLNNNLIEQKSTDLNLKEKLAKELSKEKTEIPEPDFAKSSFYEKVISFFKSNNIQVVKQQEIAKKEYEFLLKVPSAVGNIIMLARAKDKKKLNETDVAPALLSAKLIDVTCLFLTTGEFTKKAQKEIETLYTGLIVTKLN